MGFGTIVGTSHFSNFACVVIVYSCSSRALPCWESLHGIFVRYRKLSLRILDEAVVNDPVEVILQAVVYAPAAFSVARQLL